MTTFSEAETIAAGEAFFARIGGVGVVALEGDLGAGKTQFTKGICRAAGIGEEGVTSPTFGLVHEYAGTGGRRVCHFDLYRLEAEEELWSIGWEDYLDSGDLLVVEWADRLPGAIPPEAHRVRLAHVDGGGRSISIQEGREG